MITLLLSFFILLQAFASTQDPALFQRARGGFLRAIKGFGVPHWLFGEEDTPRREFTLRKHPVEDDPTNLDRRRIIDADDEKIRRVYEDLRRLQRTRASDYTGQPARLLATPIRFDRSRAHLVTAGRAYLADFAADLRGGSGAPPLIYVIGLAPDAADPADGWRLSARRAAAVAACLREHLPEPLKARGARVDSWGAASVGPGLDVSRPGPHQTFIVLAMMEAPRKES